MKVRLPRSQISSPVETLAALGCCINSERGPASMGRLSPHSVGWCVVKGDCFLHVMMWMRYLLLGLQSKYNLEKSLQLSVGSQLGVLNSSRLVLPLSVSSETLQLDANMVIFTWRAKAASITLLKIIANLLPCHWIKDWAGWFAGGCGSETVWSVKCLMRYELAISSPCTVCGKLNSVVQIIVLHHFWQRLAFGEFRDLWTV